MSRNHRIVGRLLAAAILLAVPSALTLCDQAGAQDTEPQGVRAPQPLYRDPIFDGAADPSIVWQRTSQEWLMFYTNRRAKASPEETPGVSWVHGTRIGVAESPDGANWDYRGTADIHVGGGEPTYWAPEVLYHDEVYHMYLTLVPGVFEDWGHPRNILHLTSEDAQDWRFQSTLDLSSDRCIDACVARLPDGTWRLWYNNERDRKSIYYADSTDLYNWTDKGKAPGVGERPGEGPKVFQWRGSYWMVVDLWRGLGVYRSDDATNWQVQQGQLLGEPGEGADDGVIGQHPDVVVSGQRAYLYYFTHPGRREGVDRSDEHQQRRSSIQVVELQLDDEGRLTCDRDAPTYVQLTPPE